MIPKKLPFKIGTTSYIYPDDILPNVHKLEGKVNDIELVLFEADNAGNIPTQKDLRELRRISNKWGLTYTVHLPLDINLGSGMDSERKDSVENTRIKDEVNKAVKIIKGGKATAIIVSNEVGSGLIPENKIGRDFRDIVGICNQIVARGADEVNYVVSGIPVKIKGARQ